ncbi:MAG: tetratricopeptide repeat protein [Desulfobacterales bacterium]
MPRIIRFSQSAPTLLQDMGKPRKPAPRKEDTAAFWLDKGLLYATYGNDAEAIKFYKKALQIEPENSNALFNMGVSYSSMGKYDQAIDVLNQAIFLAPDNGDYLYTALAGPICSRANPSKPWSISAPPQTLATRTPENIL